MLLAAGLGTRLRPLTNEMPKCMVPLAGKPVLQYNIEWLRSQGVADLVVNLYHYPETVTGYFGDGRAFGVNIKYSHEDTLMGTAGALWAARRFFSQERFWVVYADNLITCNLSRVATLHQTWGAAMTIALFWRQEVGASGVVGLEADGRVTAFKEKPTPADICSNWVNAGLYLCEPEVLRYIPPGRPSDFGHEVIPAMLDGGERLFGYTMGNGETLRWIDTQEDLRLTETLLSKEGNHDSGQSSHAYHPGRRRH